MKKSTKGRLRFEASANLQRLVGRELVPNEELAVAELVKNAYDSGASRVSVVIQPETKKEPGFIEISDDGSGMNIDDLNRTFMFAGYSERPAQVGSNRRVPTGEKGIGRFASDKLGVELEVTTRRGRAEPVRLQVNWNDFKDKRKKFSEIGASYEIGPIPGWGGQRHGSSLRLTRLRSVWTPAILARVQRSLIELLDPFHPPANFEIWFFVPGRESLSGKLQPPKPAQADIDLRFKVGAKGAVSRELLVRGKRPNQLPPADPGAQAFPGLAGMSGRLLYWADRPTKDQFRGLMPGVKLYRDGFRVEPFGSPTADWLGVSEHRAKRAGHAHIVPTRLLGFVEISRVQHEGLQDTTSRQALLDSAEAQMLVAILRDQLAYLENDIRVRLAEPRWQVSRKRQAVEFEQGRLQTLAIMSYGLAHELRQPLQVIRTETFNIATHLKSLGISESSLRAATINIDDGVERIEKTIRLIADVSSGDLSRVEEFDLPTAVKAVAEYFSHQGEAAGVLLKLSLPEEQRVVFGKLALQQIVANLLSNAISAVSRSGKPSGKVIIRSTTSRGQHSVEVTDNGQGIPDDVGAAIFSKFVTRTTGGMGVGLFYCKRAALALGADLRFVTRKGVGTTFVLEFSDLPE